MLLVRCAVALVLLAGTLGLPAPFFVAPPVARADVVGGSATAYNLIDASASGTRLTAPWFAFGWEGWSSVLALQNPTPLPVTVTLTARDGVSPESVTSVSVPARGVVAVNGSDLGLAPGFAGAVGIVGGPISAVVDHYGAGRNRATLPALPADGDATLAFAPLVFRGYGGWTTTLAVDNIADVPNDVEITLRPLRPAPNLPAATTRVTATIAAGAATAIPLDDTPADTLLTATIRSTNGLPLVAGTLNLNERGAASAAPAFARGAATASLPLLYREANGYSSDVLVQNVGTAPATPELRLLARDGAPRRFSAPAALQPGESHVFRLAELTGVPAGYVGAGAVGASGAGAADAQLVVLAHHLNAAAGTAMLLPGIQNSPTAFSAPVIYADYAGYATGLQVANVDTAPASVSVAFYDTFGNRLADAETLTVAPGRTASLYVPAVSGLPGGFFGSASLTAASGRKIVAAATHVRPASADTTLAIVESIPFNRLESGATNLYFAEGVPQERIQASLDGLEAARKEIPARLSVQAPTTPFDLFLFPSTNAYRRGRARLTSVPLQQVPTFSEGVFAPLGDRTAVLEDVGGPYRTPGSVAQLIAHEYTHQVIDLAVRGRSVPRWFNEGLANWAAYETIKKRYPADAARQWRSWHGVVASAISLDARVPLAQLTTYQQWVDLGNAGRDDVIYGEAVLAVDRIIDTWGPASVAQILKQVGGGSPFNVAFGRITGGDVEQFDNNLDRTLRGLLPLDFPSGVSGAPTTGSAGTTFAFMAVGWKPRQSVEITITRPNGSKLTFPVMTSAVGFLDWSFSTTNRSLAGAWRADFDGDGGDRGNVPFAVLGATALAAPAGDAADETLVTTPISVVASAPPAIAPAAAPAGPPAASAAPPGAVSAGALPAPDAAKHAPAPPPPTSGPAVSGLTELLRALPVWRLLGIT